jgi:hypothetical protein
MALPLPSVDNVRFILCCQGYNLSYQYIVREIGFCFKDYYGTIPFNCKINKKNLDINNQSIINDVIDNVHGIHYKICAKNGLTMSEMNSVLRTLYNVFETYEGSNGILIDDNDENLNGILHKAGLGNHVLQLRSIYEFRGMNISFPTNEEIRTICKNNPSLYGRCNNHNRLNNDDIPICAGVKAKIMSENLKKFKEIYDNNKKENKPITN